MTSARPLRAQPIIALDVPSLDAALALLDRLGPEADFVKVGLELFTAEGPQVVERLRRDGRRVFLDLKLHDIPNTVKGAAQRAAAMDVQLLTVHGYGGAAMVEAAVEGAGAGTGILVVTVLTSFERGALGVAHCGLGPGGPPAAHLAHVTPRLQPGRQIDMRWRTPSASISAPRPDITISPRSITT